MEKRELMERNSFLFEMLTQQSSEKTYEIVDSQRIVLKQIAFTEKKQTKLQVERAINKWLRLRYKKGLKEKPEKGTRISHGSVYGAIYELEKEGALIGEEKRKYFGNPMNEYSLTRFGVCLAILQLYYYPYEPKDRAEIGKIAEYWSFVDPVLFGKWKYFEQKFGKEIADSFLLYVAHMGIAEKELTPEEFREFVVNMLIDYIAYIRDQYNASKDDQEELRDFLKHYGIRNDANFNPETTLDIWLGAIREDPDLNKYLASYIDYVFKCAEAGLEWGNFLKGKIKSMSAPI